MLESAGKSLDIGETLTMREAASQEPGERHMKDVLSDENFVQRCGTVQVISCCDHAADCPPAMAADCAAVGSGASASPDELVDELELELEEPDSPVCVVEVESLTICCAWRLK